VGVFLSSCVLYCVGGKEEQKKKEKKACIEEVVWQNILSVPAFFNVLSLGTHHNTQVGIHRSLEVVFCCSGMITEFMRPLQLLLLIMCILYGFQIAKRSSKTRGVCVSHCGLASYIRKYLNAKEELWKFQYFTMQRYNLRKKPSKETKILQDIITL
jgi:hypothetical protein